MSGCQAAAIGEDVAEHLKLGLVPAHPQPKTARVGRLHQGRLLGNLHIDRALIVGHDLGGGVSQIMAAHHPEKIESLILINSIA